MADDPRAAKSEANRAYYAAHAERIRERARKRYAADRTPKLEAMARYRAAHAKPKSAPGPLPQPTAETATRTRARWTPAEDTLVLTDPRSARELALELQRTTRAVEQRRFELRSRD